MAHTRLIRSDTDIVKHIDTFDVEVDADEHTPRSHEFMTYIHIQ